MKTIEQRINILVETINLDFAPLQAMTQVMDDGATLVVAGHGESAGVKREAFMQPLSGKVLSEWFITLVNNGNDFKTGHALSDNDAANAAWFWVCGGTSAFLSDLTGANDV